MHRPQLVYFCLTLFLLLAVVSAVPTLDPYRGHRKPRCCPSKVVTPTCKKMRLNTCTPPPQPPSPQLVCAPPGVACEIARPDLCCSKICLGIAVPAPLCVQDNGWEVDGVYGEWDAVP
ncbi:hypothetical protein K440DRAFT_640540 [Wilcoxina mikolae CBS 423.85]|nr:hypothetical protein K440DRAFT_640540 [Wilcoxina mikolae CBS 423.85]